MAHHGHDEDDQPGHHGRETGGDEKPVNPEWVAQVEGDDNELADEGDQDGKAELTARGRK